ncbi:MAG: hypothetical protein K9M54_01460 [Kiritimatiellales bacterium]|nr:hypothetical protein [Kiritimatiellales bacterium]MCF7864214.1 hypothetical protein [Kiritimatiellales bacterium]
MKRIRIYLYFAALLSMGLCSARAEFDWDPFYGQLSSTNGAEFFAVRPFYSSSADPVTERWRKDYLWPLYTKKGFQEEQYSRFLFFGYSADFTPEDNRHHNWVIPFYFQGVDANGESYFALFPIGGTIHEFLGRDEIMFVLFPIFGKSRINEVKTTSVLWPIYSRSQGEKVDRFRVWPLYGTSSLQGEFNKKFILWPIYTSVQYTNDRNPGGGFILVPIYGHIKTEKADNYWLVPPFIRYTTSADQWIVHAPWPFIQMADGIMYKRIVWPLYGKKHLGTLTRQYFLWPFIWNNKTEYVHYDQHRRLAIPFFSYESQVVTKPTEHHVTGEVFSRYWKLWPLMSWERNETDSRFRTLDLWPMRNTPGIERNWAAYWTLYSRTNSDGEIGHDLLWGLYRQTKSPEQFEWSLLKGLVGYKNTQNNRQYRFLFMWFGGEE